MRACKAENDVPDEPSYFRTWVERYHVPPPTSSIRTSTPPTAGYDGFPAPTTRRTGQELLRPEAVQPLRALAVRAGVPGRRDLRESPDGVVLVDKKYCLGCRYCVQACPYGCRFIDPRTHTADKCDLCYHRITKGLTTACCEACPTGARSSPTSRTRTTRCTSSCARTRSRS